MKLKAGLGMLILLLVSALTVAFTVSVGAQSVPVHNIDTDKQRQLGGN